MYVYILSLYINSCVTLIKASVRNRSWLAIFIITSVYFPRFSCIMNTSQGDHANHEY